MRFFGGARVTRHIVTVQDGKYTVQDGKTWRMSHVYVAVAWFPLWCLSTSTTLWQADGKQMHHGDEFAITYIVMLIRNCQ